MIETSQPNTRAKLPWARFHMDSSKHFVCCEQTVHPAESMSPNWHTDVCSQEYCSCAWHFHSTVEPILSDSWHRCLQNEFGRWFDELKCCFQVNFVHRVSNGLGKVWSINNVFTLIWKRWEEKQIQVDLQMNNRRSWHIHVPTLFVFFPITPTASEWTDILPLQFGWSAIICWLPPFIFSYSETTKHKGVKHLK